MNCVTCNQPLIVLELQEVEIDYCLACGGIWLDAGEIELLLDDRREADILLQHLGSTPDRFVGKRKCPICLKKMEIVSIGSDMKVQIDRCRDNHGLWFDRGELTEVLSIFDPDKHGKIHELLREMFKS